ncbi:hypothetical protein K502DRAFT_352512 [Neoconidiobolus thromboides FSU 785]|nr:hypothetical protein K502DRAFT_352512 [Neoconidiobolus thromboides FSU 785]
MFVDQSNICKLVNQLRYEYQILPVKGLNPGLNYGLKINNSFTGFELTASSMPDLIHVGPIVSKNIDKLTPELENF